MASRNVLQAGSRPESGQAAFTVTGVLQRIEVRQFDGNNAFKHELVLNVGSSGVVKFIAWEDEVVDLSSAIGEQITLPVVYFKVNKYGYRLARDAEERYELVGHIPAVVDLGEHVPAGRTVELAD